MPIFPFFVVEIEHLNKIGEWQKTHLCLLSTASILGDQSDYFKTQKFREVKITQVRSHRELKLEIHLTRDINAQRNYTSNRWAKKYLISYLWEITVLDIENINIKKKQSCLQGVYSLGCWGHGALPGVRASWSSVSESTRRGQVSFCGPSVPRVEFPSLWIPRPEPGNEPWDCLLL